MPSRKITSLLAVGSAVAVSLVSVSPAAADHVHFRVLGNGQCVLLAPDGGEQEVQLPHADAFATNRRHPMHVNVHLGRPGEVGQIPDGEMHSVYVAYPASGVLTADALRICGGEFVNR